MDAGRDHDEEGRKTAGTIWTISQVQTITEQLQEALQKWERVTKKDELLASSRP